MSNPILPQDVTRFDRSMMTIVGANGRKYSMNSISGTTSSAQTTLATSDAIGAIQPGQLVCIQAAVGSGGCWYALGSSPTADATCVFLPESVQEYVYLAPGDVKIAVMNFSSSGIVNVFSVR